MSLLRTSQHLSCVPFCFHGSIFVTSFVTRKQLAIVFIHGPVKYFCLFSSFLPSTTYSQSEKGSQPDTSPVPVLQRCCLTYWVPSALSVLCKIPASAAPSVPCTVSFLFINTSSHPIYVLQREPHFHCFQTGSNQVCRLQVGEDSTWCRNTKSNSYQVQQEIRLMSKGHSICVQRQI